jgi:hypothetical protein
VIFYEMLVGRRPFGGTEVSELFEEIEHRDPRPPRQIDPELPEELERICLKCLQKKPEDRYSSALDVARDLRRWLMPKPALSRRVIVAGSLLLALATLLALTAAGFGFLGWFTMDDRQTQGRSPDSYEHGASAASEIAPPGGVSSKPQVVSMELYVRRDHDDQRIEPHALVIEGEEQALQRLDSLGPRDDMGLYAEFDRPASWYLVQFDPAGEYAIVAQSREPQTQMQFPEQGMAGFNPDDPKGINTLLLITADSPPEDVDQYLREQLGERTDVVDQLPVQWSSRLRAGMQTYDSAAQLSHEFLKQIESRLPAGHTAAHALFLKTQ